MNSDQPVQVNHHPRRRLYSTVMTSRSDSSGSGAGAVAGLVGFGRRRRGFSSSSGTGGIGGMSAKGAIWGVFRFRSREGLRLYRSDFSGVGGARGYGAVVRFRSFGGHLFGGGSVRLPAICASAHRHLSARPRILASVKRKKHPIPTRSGEQHTRLSALVLL